LGDIAYSYQNFNKIHFRIEVNLMYIVAIAWLYVVVLMAFAEKSVTAGVLTFFFYGFAPCLLLLWLFGGPGRRRHKQIKAGIDAKSMADNNMHKHDGTHAQTDQQKLGE
jgi:hypothetical protein